MKNQKRAVQLVKISVGDTVEYVWGACLRVGKIRAVEKRHAYIESSYRVHLYVPRERIYRVTSHKSQTT